MTHENEIPGLERDKNTPRSSEQAKECFGIVLILDALGAKSLTLEGARKFLALRDELAIDLPFVQKAMIRAIAESIDTSDTDIKTPDGIDALEFLQQSKHDVITFGDSFIYLLECDPKQIGDALFLMAHWCPMLFAAAIESGVFFRGALAVGYYLYGGHQSNTVLGPAVADAAAWCELADWIGIVVTPSSGYYFEQTATSPNKLRTHTQFHFFKQQLYIKYQVPLRSGHRENLWTLPWFNSDKPDSIKQKLAATFAGISMPKGTETKYANTWEYADWIWRRSLEWEQQGQRP